MRIFDRDPGDWKELQSMTGQLFEEIGCEVEVGRRVEHVRGAKEIDVFVRDALVAPPAVYLCECKHWTRDVPQEVVHSFRTVMADIGAHRGFIISSSGFQKGAFEAAKNTNIDLISFGGLQSIFFDRWRVSMGERYMPYADQLFPYWDWPGVMPKFRWTDAHRARHRELMDAYDPLVSLGPTARWKGFTREFPIVLPAVSERGEIGGRVTINSYRQFYDFIEQNKELALYHFQVLHGEIAPGRVEGEYDPRA